MDVLFKNFGHLKFTYIWQVAILGRSHTSIWDKLDGTPNLISSGGLKKTCLKQLLEEHLFLNGRVTKENKCCKGVYTNPN